VSTISEILGGKPREVVRIEGGATVFEAIKAMVDANVGAILVTDGERIAGIFTERDYLRRIAIEGRTSHNTLVHEVMTSPVLVVSPETTVDEGMALMTDKRIRHAPVVSESGLLGMISIGDLVKFITQKQSYQLQYLNEYISAR
jgi:CBS domain-containing protein